MDLTLTDRPSRKFGEQARERTYAPPARSRIQPPLAEQPEFNPALDNEARPSRARYAASGFDWRTFAIVAAIHVAAAIALLGLGVVEVPRAQSKRLTVMDIRTSPPQPEAQPRPQPQAALETPARDLQPAPVTPRIELSSQTVAAKPTPPVPPAAPAQVQAPPAPPAPPAPVTPPDFSAAQLDNAGPRYPYVSRRNREEGTVMLKVLVTPEGRAGEVEINRSSGFERLDEAAIQTVRKWRFVPARQAGKAIAAWVLVPIGFYLS